jgi:hypothetical protein
MAKLIPDAHVHVDDLEWRPWDEDRKAPFVTQGARGQAWVKVLSRDPETEAESLMYRLDPGWSADAIENTVYENLLVLAGDLDVDGTTLSKYSFSYRPEGHRSGPLSTETGAIVVAYAGFPGELASPIPVHSIDTDAMEWTGSYRGGVKMLRGDEENLDVYFLVRIGTDGTETDQISQHDAPEEALILEGRSLTYDGPTRGRHIITAGTYVHRGSGSPHGMNKVLEDHVVFKHDYFHEDTNADIYLASYPRETDAVQALRGGRMPELPKRW